MFIQLAEKIIRGYASAIAMACKALHIGPNALTVFGTALHLVPAFLFAGGHFTAGGLLLIVVVMFDSIDGTVARMTDKITKFGAMLDSCLDRYADVIIYSGLIIYTVRNPADAVKWCAPVIVILSATAAAYAVSYTRARAEVFLRELKQGFWGRVERVILLIIGLTLWKGGISLWVLAVFPHITALHRILLTRKKLRVLKETGDMDKAVAANFSLPLRILFFDFRRGSVPYDIISALCIALFIFVPMEWVRGINEWTMKYFA